MEKTGPATLVLREPLPGDEAQARVAQWELAADDFNFALGDLDGSWSDYLAGLERDRAGRDLAPGRVPATMLFALVNDEIVGRVHIRHVLTESLQEEGGYIGYGVRPRFRRRGYATEMLQQGLLVVRELGITRALVTCDDDNPGSIGTIEACGGVLEDTRPSDGGALTRRYWIDLA